MSNIKIKEAIEEDYSKIVELMNSALTPFYNGDHTAHATRIFNTHISGGKDQIGHFSFEQKMFMAIEENGHILGMINIVGKKQGTYKISPLIVDPQFRGVKGVGSKLLTYVEQYAKSNNARQMYCTVAKSNHMALQFFIRKGYVIAGESESHYRSGVKETMLYKLFINSNELLAFDTSNISVLPLSDSHKNQAEQLMLNVLPNYFNGINHDWAQALYDGYERRDSNDINKKYKLIYVAVDREDNVLGIGGATPKKGEPIKLMPLVAKDQVAFTALLRDLPYLLSQYGHKVYIHIVPTVEQTITLQKLGWSLDAAMPAAYHPHQITQQWSYTLGGNLMRTMRVKNHFLDAIIKGSKPLEVRVGYDNIKNIRQGEKIKLVSHSQEYIVKIEDVRVYSNFEEMINKENPSLIVPGKNTLQVLWLLREIYKPEREALGVYVFQMKSIK